MWTRTGTTTNQIAVGFRNPHSTIDMLGMMKLRSDWMIRARSSHTEGDAMIRDALNAAGFSGSAIKYDEIHRVFVLKSDTIHPIVHFINAISPLMQDFSEIEGEVTRLLGVDLSQHHPNPHWVSVSNHSGSTRLKYFNRHPESTISEIGVNAAGSEWKIEIKTLTSHQKEWIKEAFRAANFPLSIIRIHSDGAGTWAIRLQSTDTPVIANFVKLIKENALHFEEIEDNITQHLGIDLSQDYQMPVPAAHSPAEMTIAQRFTIDGQTSLNSGSPTLSSAGINLIGIVGNYPASNNQAARHHFFNVRPEASLSSNNPENNATKLNNIGFSDEHFKSEEEREQYNTYCCSIGLKIMTNPVYDERSPQYQFEASEILRWLQIKLEHPYTREPLTADKLKPNLELKQEIECFVEAQVSLQAALKK